MSKKNTAHKSDILQGFWDGIKPIPLLKVSEWADSHRYLTTESSAEPGRWQTDRTPYLREIMDCLSPNSPVNEVIFMKGVQLGASESALNTVGCYVDVAPCPIMYVMPTIDLAKALSEGRVDPMIENCPTLQQKIRPSRERDSGNTKHVKKFGGGILVMSGANSAASLRSRPVKILILDETDAYPLVVGEEGSPISLAEKRTSTFGMKRKIYKLSTPTLEGVSVIEREFLQTDQRYWFVPCPHCKMKFVFKFENLKWQEGNYDTTQYMCEHCHALIEERFKTRMLAAGEWQMTAPDNKNPTRRGYHLNSLYSPLGWLSWAQIAEEFEKADNNEPLQRVFVNTILGESYKSKGDAPAWQALYNRRENYEYNKPNNDVYLITAGVDVQRDRLEVEIVGWCKGKRSYSLDYRVIQGDTSKEETWTKLNGILNETWTRPDGIVIPIKMMAVDSGYNTSHVYDFCRKHDATRVIPVKGQDKQSIMVVPPRPVDVNTGGKKVGSVKVWHVGVSLIKSELYGWLRLEKDEAGNAPPGYCHFPQYPQEYFKGLTAENLEFRLVKGFQKYEWIKKYERNEPLDARVYARAATAVIGIDRFNDHHFEYLLKSYGVRQTQTPAAPVKRKKSGYWDDNENFW